MSPGRSDTAAVDPPRGFKYCRRFLNPAKEANRTTQWAFKVWAREAKRLFVWRFRAIRLLPDTIPSRTGTTHKILSREDPNKTLHVVCRGRFAS